VTGFDAAPAVFLCAPRHATRLYPLLTTSGYAVHLAHPDKVMAELATFPGRLVVADCRGAMEIVLRQMQQMSEPVRQRGAAMIALLHQKDGAELARVFRAGATHFLVAPFEENELVEMLRFAGRVTDRMSGGPSDAATPMPDSIQFDPLTSLANESLLRSWLAAVLREAVGEPAAALIVVGLGRFERLNAAHGRQVADALLRAVARRLRRLVDTSSDHSFRLGIDRLLARLPGAEFALAIAAPGGLPSVVFFAQQIANCFERPFVIDGHLIHLACRVGITISDADETGTDPGQLFRQGASALAAARSQEPNSFAVYAAGAAEANVRSVDMETELRRAINADALRLMYQPQIDIATNALLGFEVLVRWDHPTLGLLNPNDFIEVAEAAEILPQLGEGVLRTALAEVVAWQGSSSLAQLRLSVNVAASQLRNPAFDEQVAAALADTGFPPGLLTLEMTESELVDDLESAAALLHRLKRLGLRLAIDDFGTGHASYAYLKTLPFDYLKLDRAFVMGMDRDKRDRALVKSMIELARTLGMQVIAEGVESQRQLQLLSREGCNAYQGFLCSPALERGAVEPFARHWRSQHAGQERSGRPAQRQVPETNAS
jgi:EAL domain-containing protein (putative c-di-GMP-specific phosphodiesterase class I)/GGDEF domain-containing protein